MKGKDIAILILSILAIIEFIIIIFLLPVKTVEDVKENNTNPQWENITTYNK